MAYIINGDIYKCKLAEAQDIALFDRDTHQIFITGKDNHWSYNGITWRLVYGGYDESTMGKVPHSFWHNKI